MKKLLAIVLVLPFMLSAYAQSPGGDASSCEAKAVGKNGKPLAGAAKASFMKKCQNESGAADAKSNCESKAVSKDGKPLHGAAKAASVKKCMSEAK